MDPELTNEGTDSTGDYTPMVEEPTDGFSQAMEVFSGDLGLGTTATVVLLAALATFAARRIAHAASGTRLRRRLPLIYAVIWLLTIIGLTVLFFRSLAPVGLILFAAFVIAFFTSVGGLRAVLAGVVLTVEDRFRIGDVIRIGDVQGEIIAFEVRCVRLRSSDGTTFEVPNQAFVTETIANVTGDGSDSACDISSQIPAGINPERALEIARTVAMVTPFASPRHKPEVFVDSAPDEAGALHVRIRGFAFDQAHQDHYKSDVLMRLRTHFSRLSESEPLGERKVIRDLVLDD